MIGDGGRAGPGRDTDCAEHGETNVTRAKAEPALMEAVVERLNMQRAYQRVVRNKGAAGVDGLGVSELRDLLRQHWPTIKAKLLEGRYCPQPVRQVSIPKPNGGERKLGIPTVLDRLIQQALNQVLSPIFESTFSEHSYGFRPGAQCPSSGPRGAATCAWGPRLGSGLGSGELLRPGPSRSADAPRPSQGRRPPGADADPPVSEGRVDGGRSAKSTAAGHPARRAPFRRYCQTFC